MEIHSVGFDWDGTIVKTMQAKSEAFAEACIKQHPQIRVPMKMGEVRKQIADKYLETRGISRFQQLKEVERMLNLSHLQDEQEWSGEFSDRAEDKTENASMQPHAEELLQQLNQKGLKLFVSSAVPHFDLHERVKSYGLKDYFELVMGQRYEFRKGPVHIGRVEQEFSLHSRNIALVGDSNEDMRAAEEAGCGLKVAYDDPELPKREFENADHVIADLREVLEYV